MASTIRAVRFEPSGAWSPSVGVLTLEDIVAEMAPHGLETDILVERGAIFGRAIGPAFDALPKPIRAPHEAAGRSLWRGEAVTHGAAHPFGALVARLIGFPSTQAACPVTVEIEADGERAAWRRRIGGRTFSSVLSRPRSGGRVAERFGPLTMELTLTPEDGRLVYRVRGWRLGPIPLPRALVPRTTAHEEVDAEGRFVFDVEISAPLVGRLVHYRGWLVREI